MSKARKDKIALKLIYKDISVGRFRVLGGQGLEFWGGQGGAKFPAGT